LTGLAHKRRLPHERREGADCHQIILEAFKAASPTGKPFTRRVAFKPVATVMREQPTSMSNSRTTTLRARGRHDPCVLPRAVPMVEAMAALVLVDHALRQRAQCG